MFIRAFAKRYPKSLVGKFQNHLQQYEVGEQYVVKSFYAGALGGVCGTFIGAYSERNDRIENAVWGGICGMCVGFLYPLSIVTGVAVASSYIPDIANYRVRIEQRE